MLNLETIAADTAKKLKASAKILKTTWNGMTWTRNHFWNRYELHRDENTAPAHAIAQRDGSRWEVRILNDSDDLTEEDYIRVPGSHKTLRDAMLSASIQHCPDHPRCMCVECAGPVFN